MNVSEVMTHNVVTVTPATPVIEALRLMILHHVSGLPVVDGEGKLAGVITEGDFLRRHELGTGRKRPHWLEFVVDPGRLADEYIGEHGQLVGDVMTTPALSINADASLADAVHTMETRKVKRLPVVRDGSTLMGVISRADLVRALVAEVERAQGTAQSDEAIAARIRSEIDQQPWTPRATVSITVSAGVVDLRGIVTDDRQRDALRVLVQTIQGVNQVLDHLTTVEPVTGFVIRTPETT